MRLWIPNAVAAEFADGQRRGYDVLTPANHKWLMVVDPGQTPSEWLSLDLGHRELAAMSLALENPDKVVLLDDRLARRIAKAAGLAV